MRPPLLRLARREPGSMTPHQVFENRLAATIMCVLSGVAITDLGPFRVIRHANLLGLDVQDMTYGWSAEMMVKAARHGSRYVGVPVSYRGRAGGVSKVASALSGGVRAGWCILSTTFRYWRWSPRSTPLPAKSSAGAAIR